MKMERRGVVVRGREGEAIDWITCMLVQNWLRFDAAHHFGAPKRKDTGQNHFDKQLKSHKASDIIIWSHHVVFDFSKPESEDNHKTQAVQ